MIFALDTDNGEVRALSSPLEAAQHCKPIDVKDGFWLFFADDGSPLEPRFDSPEDPMDPGPYSLERAMSGRWLQERIGNVATVNGRGLTSIEDLVETLRVNRSRRVSGNARPGTR